MIFTKKAQPHLPYETFDAILSCWHRRFGASFDRALDSTTPLNFDPISAYLLGVAPNLAAAVATIFVRLSISTDHKRNAELSAIRYRFFIFAAVSGIGLIGWELFQETSKRLVFDPHDLFATLVRNWHSHAPVFRDYSSNV